MSSHQRRRAPPQARETRPSTSPGRQPAVAAEELQPAAAASEESVLGAFAASQAQASSDPPPCDPADVRVAPDAAAEDRFTLRGGTHRFGALMHIAESGDYGEGGLTPDTVITEDGRSVQEVYELYRAGRIGSENNRWEGHTAASLADSIRQRGYVDSEESAQAAGLADQVGDGRGEFHRLRLIPSTEVQADQDIDTRLDGERGFRHFIVHGHQRDQRGERRERGEREIFLAQLEPDGQGGFRRRDGAELSADDQARLRQDLPRNAEGRGLLRGSALEAYRAHVSDPSNPPIDPTTWARQQLAQQPAQAAPAEASGDGDSPDSPSVRVVRTVPVGQPAPADEPVQPGGSPSVRVVRTVPVGTPAPRHHEGVEERFERSLREAGDEPVEDRRGLRQRGALWREAERDYAAEQAIQAHRAAEAQQADPFGRAGADTAEGAYARLADDDRESVDAMRPGGWRERRRQRDASRSRDPNDPGPLSADEQADVDAMRSPTRATGSVDLAERQVQAGIEHRFGEGDNAITASGTARATVNDDLSGLSGAGVRGEVSRGRTTIHADLGYTADIASPVGPIDDAGRYVIRGTLTWTGQLGGSQGSRQRRVTAGVRVGETRTFTRNFASRREAEAWHADATAYFNARAWSEFGHVNSAEAADEMAVGDQRMLRQEGGANLGASGRAGPYSVGFSVGVTASLSCTVIRSSENAVRVRFDSAVGENGSINGSVGGLGGSLGRSRADLSGVIIEYELRDESGEHGPGYAALQRVLEHRQPPEGDRGDGWRVVERSEGERRGSSSGVTFGTASIENSSSATDRRIVDEDGEYVQNQAEARRGTSMGLPSALTEGTIFGDTEESFNFETDTRDRGGSFRFGVQGATAQQTNEMIARAAGVQHNANVQGPASGEWQLTADLSPSELRDFIRAVHAGRWNPGAVGAAWTGDAERLRAAVRSSSNFDEAQVAVRDYLRVTRDRGCALIRQVLGTETLSVDVVLRDSNVWTGRAGQERLRRQIGMLQAQLQEDPEAARAEIQQAWEQQRDRVNAMRDRERFNDLPEALRQQEIAENESLLGQLAQLRRRARAQIAQQRERASDGPGTLEEAVATGQAVRPLEARRGVRQATEDAGNERERAQLRAAQQRLDRKYRETLTIYQAVGRERRIHEGSANVHEGGRPARQALGGGRLVRLVGGTSHTRTYARSDELWATGRRAWTEGDREKNAMERAIDAIPGQGAIAVEVHAAVEAARRAFERYEDARLAFTELAQSYDGIRRSVGTDDSRQYFGGTTFDAGGRRG